MDIQRFFASVLKMGSMAKNVKSLFLLNGLQGQIQDLSEGGARFISEQ